MQTEEEFIIHSQQHSSTGAQSSTPLRQVSPQTGVSGHSTSNSGAGPQTAIPCIVCRQTLVSFLELRLHARHHFQSQRQAIQTPPLPLQALSSVSVGGARLSGYVCCVCLGQFDTADSVIARAGGYFVCVSCNSRDSGLVLFDVGQTTIRSGPSDQPTRSYQCIKCQESFSNELDVRVHVTGHVINEGNVHECRLCNSVSPVVFDSPARLQSHIITDHEFGADISTLSSVAESTASGSAAVVKLCAVCGVKLVGPAAARVHSMDHGPSSWPHGCQQCPLKFFFAAELRNHLLVTGHHHQHVAASLGRSPSTTVDCSPPGLTDDLRCQDCSRVFSGYASLCSHRRVHEKSSVAMTLTPVSVTDVLMQDCNSLEGHYSVSHVTENGGVGLAERGDKNGMTLSKGPSMPLQCPECSRQFPSLSSLQGHMRVHSSGKLVLLAYLLTNILWHQLVSFPQWRQS